MKNVDLIILSALFAMAILFANSNAFAARIAQTQNSCVWVYGDIYDLPIQPVAECALSGQYLYFRANYGSPVERILNSEYVNHGSTMEHFSRLCGYNPQLGAFLRRAIKVRVTEFERSCTNNNQ